LKIRPACSLITTWRTTLAIRLSHLSTAISALRQAHAVHITWYLSSTRITWEAVTSSSSGPQRLASRLFALPSSSEDLCYTTGLIRFPSHGSELLRGLCGNMYNTQRLILRVILLETVFKLRATHNGPWTRHQIFLFWFITPSVRHSPASRNPLPTPRRPTCRSLPQHV